MKEQTIRWIIRMIHHDDNTYLIQIIKRIENRIYIYYIMMIEEVVKIDIYIYTFLEYTYNKM